MNKIFWKQKRPTPGNRNWVQAIGANPKLKPWGDRDGDRKLNMFDCKPLNRRRQDDGEEESERADRECGKKSEKERAMAEEGY